MENELDINNEWKLQKIELELQTFGDNKGKYIGKIKFQNGDYESISFKIKPNMAQQYIDLMSSDIVKHTEALNERLLSSLNLKD